MGEPEADQMADATEAWGIHWPLLVDMRQARKANGPGTELQHVHICALGVVLVELSYLMAYLCFPRSPSSLTRSAICAVARNCLARLPPSSLHFLGGPGSVRAAG